jgi:hypothetical protein
MYSSSGCDKIHDVDTIREHESRCPYGPFRCPYHTAPNTKCLWTGSLSEVKNHVESTHAKLPHNVTVTKLSRSVEQQTELFQANLPLETFSSSIEYHEIEALSEFFVFACTVKDSLLYACVLHVGHRVSDIKYKYCIMIKTHEGERVIQYHPTYSYLDNIEDLIEKGHCAVFHCDFALECMDERKKELKMEIEMIEMAKFAAI